MNEIDNKMSEIDNEEIDDFGCAPPHPPLASSFKSRRPSITQLGYYSIAINSKPYAASLLGVSVDEVEMLDEYSIPYRQHIDNAKCLDNYIKTIPFEGSSVIHLSGAHSREYSKIGLTLFATKQEKPVNYVVLNAKDPDYSSVIVFYVPKGSVYRFVRYKKKKLAMAVEKDTPPLLEDGLLDQIVNSSVGILLKKRKIVNYGAKVRCGLVLSGSPGNGKTMLCRWIQKICAQKGIETRNVDSGSIRAAFGSGKDKFYSLFNSPGVTFFDDIDVDYFNRTSKCSDIACAILSALDGVNNSENIVRIFTTNEKIGDMDSAFIRPGRIDRCFEIKKPNNEMKKKLILTWHPEIIEYIFKNNFLESFLEKAEGFSFAELDAIRSILITNKVTTVNGSWDYIKAFEDYNKGRLELEDKKDNFGFGKSTRRK